MSIQVLDKSQCGEFRANMNEPVGILHQELKVTMVCLEFKNKKRNC